MGEVVQMSDQKWLSFDCSFCPSQFYSEQELGEHLQQYHIYRCNVCAMGFYFEEELRYHKMKDHNDMISFVPQDAPKNSTVSNNDKRFECNKCRKNFKDSWHKERHLQSQTNCELEKTENPPVKGSNKKSAKCEICDKTFKNSWHLSDHMVVHTDERPFKCDDCDTQFKRVDSLKRHRKKSNTCDECEIIQPCLSGLKKHKLNAHALDNLQFHSGNKADDNPDNQPPPRTPSKNLECECGYAARN